MKLKQVQQILNANIITPQPDWEEIEVFLPAAQT